MGGTVKVTSTPGPDPMILNGIDWNDLQWIWNEPGIDLGWIWTGA